MVEDEIHLVLPREVVESAGLEVVESVVGRSDDRQSFRRAVELVVDLVPYLCLGEEAHKGGVLAAFG